MNNQTTPQAQATEDDETCPPGGCEWEFCDDSFDHEFGTERVHYEQCRICNATRALDSDDGDYDPPEPDNEPCWENGKAYY